MATSDYLVKKFILPSYTISNSVKFKSDKIFINNLKDKNIISYSDNTSYIYENCYPDYLYTKDGTDILINNSIECDFNDLNNVINKLTSNNIIATTFTRSNKITDLSHLKNMSDNTSQKSSLIIQTSVKKLIESILIKEDTMNLATFTNLNKDILFDNELNMSTNETFTQYFSNFDEHDEELIIPKLFYGDYNHMRLFVNYNNTLSTSTVSVGRHYRNIIQTPRKTGQYKVYIEQYPNIGLVGDSQGYNGRGLVIYKDINISTYQSNGLQNGTLYYKYVYLTKGVTSKIHTYITASYVTNSDYLAVIDISYTGEETDTLNLLESTLLFEDIDGNIVHNYEYNGVTYETLSIKNKILVQILNIQTHLIMFNTKGNIFAEHEKYAINNYCIVKFKFANSAYPSLFKYIFKPLEIKE